MEKKNQLQIKSFFPELLLFVTIFFQKFFYIYFFHYFLKVFEPECCLKRLEIKQ